MQNSHEIKRKKIIYRARYRGTKELDLIIGAFIKQNIDDDNMLDALIALLDCHDGKLHACLINGENPPAEIADVFVQLQEFSKNYKHNE